MAASNATSLDPSGAIGILSTLLPLVVVIAVLHTIFAAFLGRRRHLYAFVILATGGALVWFNVVPVWMLIPTIVLVAWLWVMSTSLSDSGWSSPTTAPTTVQSLTSSGHSHGELGECSKCDAMQSKLNIAETKLERALEDSGPAFIQARELEMLKGGLRILRQRDGTEQIIFTKFDEEDWDELYDELEAENKIYDERQEVEALGEKETAENKEV